jgi:predicted nuclease with TOPRIM domain
LQTKDQTISTLTTENNNFQSALNAAETRLNEFYADQSRIEEEMAARIEVAEKLRTQVRELEKEKRDALRRYNEQVSTDPLFNIIVLTPCGTIIPVFRRQLSKQNGRRLMTTSSI